LAFERYRKLLVAVGIDAIEINGETHPAAPYNLLFTREWILLVPRSAEFVEGVAVNALGFAGTLFVRNEEQRQLIRRLGPMTILQRAGIA
jgi:ATP adenylyltransferase